MLLTHFISLMIQVSAHNIINTDFGWIGALVMQVIRITNLLKDYKVFRSSIQEIKPFIVGCGVGIAQNDFTRRPLFLLSYNTISQPTLKFSMKHCIQTKFHMVYIFMNVMI